MHNISEIVLKRIQEEINGLLEELNKGIEWADHYLKAESKRNTGYKLKKARRKLKNIRKAITLRPSAALFGESQVGKSYLIKTFLSDDKGKFDITDPKGEKVSFLEEINPKGGGVESTSVVCRFSTKVSSPDSDFPLIGKLLSVKEIVLMLCDTYFNDVKNHVNLPTAEKIDNKIQELQDAFGTSSYRQDIFQEDDVYDIKEYLEEHFGSFIGSLSISKYWDVLGSLIHRIDHKNWFEAFEIVFGKNKYIEDTFNMLILELKALDFTEEVYLEFDSVLRKHGTILNVARLRELNGTPQYEDVVNEKDFKGEVLLKWYANGSLNNGRKINKSTLCALLAEIAFKVDEQKEEDVQFLKNSDLLDFPGAQPRLENNEEEVADKHVSEMVLRGKVGYLFNKYSSQYLISNLLLCHHNRDLKAKSISSLLNTWINNFIGKTPAEREAFLQTAPVPPLFKIFTYFNVDLAFDAINDKDPSTYPTKWSKRFHTIFEKQIVNSASYNWHEQWTASKKTFQNNYLLRDFYWSKDIFSGFEETGMENAYVKIPSVNDYYDKVKKSFINSDLVQKYFKDPQRSWDEAASINKDGSEWILDNLTKVSSNFAKTLKFVRDLNDICEEVTKEISRHFHSDDADQQIVMAKSNADELRFHLDNIFGVNPSIFGHFVKTFTIREDEVYDFYRSELNSIDRSKHKNFSRYIAIRNRCERLSTSASYEENLQVLLETYTNLSGPEEAERVFEEEGINLQFLFYGDDSINIKNNSEMLAEGVIELWIKRFTQDRFQFILDSGLKEHALENLFDNLRVSVKKHGVHERIAHEIRDYVDRIDKIDEVIFMIADISAGIINKYFNSMGWSYYEEDERDRIQHANKENNLDLKFERLENKLDYRDNEEISNLFDQMKNYTKEVNKPVPNREVINRYPNFWNFNRWSELMKISFVANCDIPTYDVRANQALGEIIEDVGKYTFKEDMLAA
jgi:hypothetical protein